MNVPAPAGWSTQSGYVGLAYAGPPSVPDGSGGYTFLADATSPGCQCEGWGVAGNGVSGFANVDDGGPNGVTLVSFASTASTAVSVVTIDGVTLQVTQDYHPSAGAPTSLYEATVTITNTGAAAVSDVRYTRAMDWDVPPNEFNEYVTIFGNGATNLLYTGNNGFASADPLTGFERFDGTGGQFCGQSVDFVDCGTGDHGALFDFGFGSLDPGSSVTFNIYYGAAANELDALAALFAVGAEVYSLGQTFNAAGGPCNDCTTFIFGFSGVGGEVIPEPVPEPATLLLFGSGLAGLAARLKKRIKS